jgi:hypothetical protein
LWRFVVGRVDPDVSKERNPSFSALGGLLELLDPEDEGTTIIRNAGNHSRHNTS